MSIRFSMWALCADAITQHSHYMRPTDGTKLIAIVESLNWAKKKNYTNKWIPQYNNNPLKTGSCVYMESSACCIKHSNCNRALVIVVLQYIGSTAAGVVPTHPPNHQFKNVPFTTWSISLFFFPIPPSSKKRERKRSGFAI